MTAPLVDVSTVSVHQDLGDTLEGCVRSLAAQLAQAGRLADVEAYVADVLAREAQGATALPGGVALPHARSAGVAVPSVGVATLPAPVTAANGEEFDLVLLLAVPRDGADQYLRLLSQVTTAVVKPAFRDDCRRAETPERLASLAAAAVGGR